MRWILSLTLLLFISCSHQAKQAPRQKTLNINFTHEIPTADPRRCGEPISSTFIFMLYEGLTRHSPRSSCELALAKEVQLSADRCTYTFILRDVKWNNGAPVTARDFEASWKDMLNPKFPSPNASLLYPIKNALLAKQGKVALEDVPIRAVDDKTLVVELERPTPFFLEITSFCALFPTYHPKIGKASSYDHISPKLVTNGPFQVIDTKMSDHITLAPNPLYHQRDRIKLDRVNISFVQDDNTALEMFENNELDLAGVFFSEIPTDALNSPYLKKLIHKREIAATSFFSFNTDRFPFNNPHIRKAIHHAVNRQGIVDNITELNDTIASGLIPAIQIKGVESNPFIQDVEQAKLELELGLDELGITKDALPPIYFSYHNSPVNHKIAQAVQYQVSDILGLEVKLESLDFIHYLQNITSRNYSLAMCKVIAQYNDPMDILIRFTDTSNLKNYPGWSNPNYTKLVEEAMSVGSAARRQSYYLKAQDIMIEQLPLSPLFHDRLIYMAHPRVKGFFISSIASIHIDGIDLEEE